MSVKNVNSTEKLFIDFRIEKVKKKKFWERNLRNLERKNLSIEFSRKSPMRNSFRLTDWIRRCRAQQIMCTILELNL